MEQHMLRLTLVLGVLVTILGGTGVFAVFSDQASGGRNTVVSGIRPSAADLKIATASGNPATGGVDCGAFADNSAIPQFTVTDLQPDSPRPFEFVCRATAGPRRSHSVSARDRR